MLNFLCAYATKTYVAKLCLLLLTLLLPTELNAAANKLNDKGLTQLNKKTTVYNLLILVLAGSFHMQSFLNPRGIKNSWVVSMPWPISSDAV